MSSVKHETQLPRIPFTWSLQLPKGELFKVINSIVYLCLELSGEFWISLCLLPIGCV